jgi:phosphohistidine phosphatase
MRTLILMRHAKAVKGSEAPSDEARGLAARGERDAAEAGAVLARFGLAPSLALVSTARRTRETAALALAALRPQVRYEEALYHAAPEAIWEAFAATDAESVIVVGHNPGIAELTSFLIAQASDRSALGREFAGNFPTCGFAAFSISGDLMHAAGPSLIGAWKPEKD